MQRSSDTTLKGHETSNDEGKQSSQPGLPLQKHKQGSKQGSNTKHHTTFGSGTLLEPFIHWMVKPPKSQMRVNACNKIVKEEAQKHRALVAVIRKENHSSVRERDASTGEPTGEQVPADNHITLYLGRDIKDLQKQGHVYTVVDRKSNLTRVMKPSERKIVFPGQERVGAEYWDLQDQPLANIDMSSVVEKGIQAASTSINDDNSRSRGVKRRRSVSGKKR